MSEIMYESTIDILKKNGVVLERGLTLEEITEIEQCYGFVFPKSLKDFLMTVLPVSKGFYNWRDMSPQNIERIKCILNNPKKYINELPKEVYWCEDWGPEPNDDETFKTEVRKRLKTAPLLMPIYIHRYMPQLEEENPPVVSIHGADIIYMGENLEDYFKVEFREKKQSEINFSNIKPIVFWSDLM